jgi:hypothetical protein
MYRRRNSVIDVWSLVLVWSLMLGHWSFAQEWSSPVRGSWVREGEKQDGDVVLVDESGACDIIVGDNEDSAVKQAAAFLAGDIEKIAGRRPAIVARSVDARREIHLSTAPGSGQNTKWNFPFQQGDWEALEIKTVGGQAYLTGSNARGTAFAAYTLCERLGIDPLYLWTGYTPLHRSTLIMKAIDYASGPPTVRYRGLFHDDEDILPRPFESTGYPLRTGDVATEWYARFFETALRLRMNMVAPYTRVHRRYEVQKLASDWGLVYTSHHYDILLSNPYGIERFSLGEKRHAGKEWNWLKNREGMLNYWRGGVEENRELDCIWPVGLRGTDDMPHRFDKQVTAERRRSAFREAIESQVKMVKEMLPAGRPAAFHFTMYNEMLEAYLKDPGAFALPDDVIIVWPDDNDGRIRFLPKEPGKWKHGVYYHLAYLGPVPKQNAHVVTPARVAGEFRKIIDAGANEFVLVNVSELREFIMEARMIADICWDAKAALKNEPLAALPDKPLPDVPTRQGRPATHPTTSPAADRYLAWWCREYFGQDAAPLAQEIYQRYYQLLNSYDKQWYGSTRVQEAIDALAKKFAGTEAPPVKPYIWRELDARDQDYRDVFALVEKARAKMSRQQRQYFFDHVELPMLMDWRPVQAAMLLMTAIESESRARAFAICDEAMKPLEQLEIEIARAEHPPFEQWYRKTWVRQTISNLNVHRPYEQLRAFLSSGGREKLREPEASNRTTTRKE